MRLVYMSDERARQAFAEEAARHFKACPEHSSYSNTVLDVQPGGWFALRWGLSDDCVLVFKVADEEPVIYGQLIRNVEAKP